MEPPLGLEPGTEDYKSTVLPLNYGGILYTVYWARTSISSQKTVVLSNSTKAVSGTVYEVRTHNLLRERQTC